MSEKAFVQTRKGEVIEIPKAELRSKLESGDYLPATEKDKAAAEKDERNSTLGAKAKTFAESAAAGAIDVAQAPLAAPIRLGAAALGYDDPLKGTGGRDTLQNLAAIGGNVAQQGEGAPAPGTSGTTLGGEAYGREYAANARARAEANPGAATAGQFAGAMLGGGALSGGAGAIGSGLASRLGGGLAARLGGSLARGAIEGAAYGEAGASEESYLHDIPLSGEKLIASMGLGAILGGGVSLGAEGLGALVRRGTRGATPLDSPRLAHADIGAPEGLGLPEHLREFADAQTGKALGITDKTAKRLGRTAEEFSGDASELAQAVRGMKLEDGTDVFQPLQAKAGLADRLQAKLEQVDTRLEDFRTQAAAMTERHPEIAPQPAEVATRIRTEIADKLAAHPDSATAALSQPIEQIATDLDRLGAKEGGPVLFELTDMRNALDARIAGIKAGAPMQSGPVRVEDLSKARDIIEGEIEASTDKAAQYLDKSQAQAYKQTKTDWDLLTLAKQIGEGAAAEDGGLMGHAKDYGAAIVGALAHGGLGGLASGIASKVAREHASSVMAVLADRLANSLDGKIDAGLGSFFKESAQRAAAGAAGAGKLAPAVPIRRSLTPLAVDAFMGRSKDLASAYAKRTQELADANLNNGSGARARMEHAMGPGFEATPKLTQAATVTATRGAQYLQSQMPGGTKSPTTFEPSRTLPPSDLEMAVFAQKWAAVANPLSVVDDLRRGTVTHAQIDAVKAVYPALYAQIQQKTMTLISSLDARGKRIPFDDRLQLDLFLDLDGAGEPTLAGGFVDRLSAMLAADQARRPKPPPPSESPLNGLAASAKPASESVLQGG